MSKNLYGRPLRAAAAIALWCGMSASAVLAQMYHAAPMAIDVEDWALTPIVVDTPDGDRVHSFLALNQGAAFETNLQAVWYIKDTENECSWYALTSDTSDPWDAIKTVKVSLGISDDDDPNWAVRVESTPWSEPKELFDYSAGFMADDALGRGINTLPDRDEWVAWLVDIGYKAAEIKFEKAWSSAQVTVNPRVAGTVNWSVRTDSGGK